MTKSFSAISTIKIRIFEETRQLKFATQGVIYVLPSQLFSILVASFSVKATHLTKYMVVAYTTGPLTPAMIASSTPFHHFSMRAPEIVDRTAFSNVNPASCKEKNLAARDKSQPAKEKIRGDPHTFVATVHYKQTIERESQIREHIPIQSDAT